MKENTIQTEKKNKKRFWRIFMFNIDLFKQLTTLFEIVSPSSSSPNTNSKIISTKLIRRVKQTQPTKNSAWTNGRQRRADNCSDCQENFLSSLGW